MVSPEVLTDSSLSHSHTDNTNKEPSNTSVQVDNSKPSINIIQGVKQPSYLNLACCISGYTTLTTYNSKQREGFRSRDISPARITGAAGAPDDAVFTSICGNFLSPQPRYLTDMDHRKKGGDKMWNGNSNGTVDKLSSTFTSTSTCVTGNSSFYHCETRKEVTSSTCLTESVSVTSHSKEVPSQTSSFILQRVERLYGPGALAQGFYTRRSLATTPQKETKTEEAVKDEASSTALPVLRLLRPEFRAQLSLAKRKSSFPSRISDTLDGAIERIIPVVVADSDGETKDYNKSKERETVNQPTEKDGLYYLKLVTEETQLLLHLAAELEMEVNHGIPEHMEGRLRAAAGKARLLANQKLAQFKGLCHKNINQDKGEDFPTTCEDLAGFWDMVLIQINSVHEEFSQIDTLRKADWPLQENENAESKKEVISNGSGNVGARKSKAPPRSTSVAAPSPAKSSLSKARDEARKRMLAERRKEMRKNASTVDDIVIV